MGESISTSTPELSPQAEPSPRAGGSGMCEGPERKRGPGSPWCSLGSVLREGVRDRTLKLSHFNPAGAFCPQMEPGCVHPLRPGILGYSGSPSDWAQFSDLGSSGTQCPKKKTFIPRSLMTYIVFIFSTYNEIPIPKRHICRADRRIALRAAARTVRMERRPLLQESPTLPGTWPLRQKRRIWV